MTALTWNSSESRHEKGIDRGVLYLDDADGIAWNGLISIEESLVGADLDSYYYDGYKYLDIVANTFYQAKVSAFTYPEEFSACLGDVSLYPGLIVTQQPYQTFSMTYRTMVGENLGFKLHIVYNATATLSSRTYNTIADTSDLNTLEFTIDAVPPYSEKFRPTAHFIIDSTKINPGIFEEIQTFLYGNQNVNAHLPDLDTLISFITNWDERAIFDVPDSGIDELRVSDQGDLTRTDEYGIYQRTANGRLKPTSTPGIYRLG